MSSPGRSPIKRRLVVDLSELEIAFENSLHELSYYLDLQTGEVVLVTEDARREVEGIYAEVMGEDGQEMVALEEALQERDLKEWQREDVRVADRVEEGFRTRYIEVPGQDSREGYHQMEEFIETVEDERLRERLRRAIRGRGAFGRFNQVLYEHPQEREHWHEFREQALRRRIHRWLDEEGIEPQM